MIEKCGTLLTRRRGSTSIASIIGIASDARNVRLGLASDGFNPFGMQNVTYINETP